MRSDSGDDGHDHGDDRGLDFASKESRSWFLLNLRLSSDRDQVSWVVPSARSSSSCVCRLMEIRRSSAFHVSPG